VTGLRVGEAQQRARRAGRVEVQLPGVVAVHHRQRRGDGRAAADQQPPLRGARKRNLRTAMRSLSWPAPTGRGGRGGRGREVFAPPWCRCLAPQVMRERLNLFRSCICSVWELHSLNLSCVIDDCRQRSGAPNCIA